MSKIYVVYCYTTSDDNYADSVAYIGYRTTKEEAEELVNTYNKEAYYMEDYMYEEIEVDEVSSLPIEAQAELYVDEMDFQQEVRYAESLCREEYTPLSSTDKEAVQQTDKTLYMAVVVQSYSFEPNLIYYTVRPAGLSFDKESMQAFFLKFDEEYPYYHALIVELKASVGQSIRQVSESYCREKEALLYQEKPESINSDETESLLLSLPLIWIALRKSGGTSNPAEYTPVSVFVSKKEINDFISSHPDSSSLIAYPLLKNNNMGEQEQANALADELNLDSRLKFRSVVSSESQGVSALSATPASSRSVMDILPTSNLDFNTIRDTLNAGGGTVSNETWTAFKTTSGINIWAKFKPVGYTADFPAYDSDWYKGNDKMCGLNIPNVNGDPDPIKNAKWSYNPPKGGQKEPFRLGDFRGYNRKCQFFITGWWKKQTIKLQKGDALLTVQCAILRPTQTNNLQIEDVELLANIRLALKITGGGRSWIKTSTNKGADVSHDSGILQCQVDFDKEVPFSFDTGLYTVTQFLTTSDYSTLGTFPTIIQSYAMPNYYEGDFVNEQQVQYMAVADGFEIIAEALSNSLNGTYNNEEYYMQNPFKVKANSYEYWKCKLTNKSQKESRTFNLSTLHYYSTNASGTDVEDDGSNVNQSELKLYNSTMVELSSRQITVGPDTSITIYIRTRLFSKQATITSGMLPLTVLTYANYTDTALNINNRLSCRFECRIQGSL